MLNYAKLFSSRFKCRALDRPIFIWGSPRSGTTLLYQLVAKHPDVGCPCNANKEPREGTDFWWRAFGEHRGVMDARLAHPKSVRQINYEYRILLKEQGKSRLLDKIPFMILWIQLVNKMFPDARHFHIIRDGRSVVNSVLYKLRYSRKKKDQRYRKGELLYGPQPPELINPMLQPPAQRHVRQWILLVEYGRQSAELLGNRYYELRYEDLVNDPRNTMKNVLEHAQLAHDEKFINNIYPDKLENRNYKWRSDKHTIKAVGFTAHRAFEREDIVYLEEMNPLLCLLSYESL